MKLRPFTFLILFFGLVFFAHSQEPPIANDDYAVARVHKTTAIRVLDNDSSYNNNPVRIIQVYVGYPLAGITTWNDSLIFHTPTPLAQDTNIIRYLIIDTKTNLVSNIARVDIDIINDGFEYLDKNQVKCRINAGGMQFNLMDPNDGYEVPSGEGTHSFCSKTIYIGGFDANGELHLAGENYKIKGPDFYPGPLSDTVNYTNDYDIRWHKVWKLDREEIDFHRANWQQPGYEPIENIRDWPGNGDPALGQASLLAPFYDWDNDGIYDPMKGDFPLIKGDQAIFNLYNDDRIHTESGGKKLGVEIQAMYYAYDRPYDSALSQTVFGSKTIINRSQKDYHDVYAAFFVDFQIGYEWDDFIGCDTMLHSAFVYNGLPIDEGWQSNAYGAHPPAQSFTCLNFNMDSFINFYRSSVNPSPEIQTPPKNAVEFYNYMKSIWRDGTPLTYGGTGHGGEIPVSYAFPGDPVTNEGWTEESAEIEPGYRRGLVTTGPTTLLSGDTLTLDFALVFARDYEGDNLTSVALLKERIQQVRDFYQEALGVEEIHQDSPALKVYPNPFTGELFVVTTSFGEQINWRITDISGSIISQGKQMNSSDFRLDLTGLRRGVYFLHLNDGRLTGTAKLIKTR